MIKAGTEKKGVPFYIIRIGRLALSLTFFPNYELIKLINMFALCTCYRANWVKIYGYEYYPGDFVLCGWQSDDLPIFAKVDSTNYYRSACVARGSISYCWI